MFAVEFIAGPLDGHYATMENPNGVKFYKRTQNDELHEITYTRRSYCGTPVILDAGRIPFDYNGTRIVEHVDAVRDADE